MVGALTGGWSASAAALAPLPPPPITLPTITLPIVTVPPVTVPPATTPAVTTPTVPIPPQVPPPPARTTTAVDAQPPPSQPRDDSGPAGVGRSSGEANQGARVETSREQASRLRLARMWFVVVLPGPSLVELAVNEVAPECRLVRRFRVRAHRGANRVRLARHPLGPGAYVVVARALPTGRIVGRARFAIGDRARSGGAADSCRREQGLGSASSPGRPPAGALPAAADPKQKQRSAHHRGVLGTKFGKGVLASAGGVPLWVYGLLALAVGLLAAAAALPKADSRGLSASLLAGSVGAGILLALTIVFSLG